jgi:AcrR family transcriptional regulator
MSPRTQKQFEKIRKNRKEAIFDAALHLYAEEGFHAASISKIASRAKISKGLIYNYFESKDELLRQLLSNLMDNAIDLFGLKNKTELSKDDFVELIDKSFQVVLDDVQHWKLYFAVIAQPHVLNKYMAEMMGNAAPFIKLYMDYFTKLGYEDPIAQMHYFSAVIDGVQLHLMLDPENFPLKPIRDQIVKQFT